MNRAIWNFLTSLRLTVVCLAFAIILVFIGTVAQADEGLYQAQVRYFQKWFVWMPMMFGHRLPLALPGGNLIGTVLLVNLVAAHIKRFSWGRKKFGIHLTHFGVVVMILGQLATQLLSRESHLRLREGETRNYTESHREHELVFATDAAPGTEEVVSIPEPLLAKRGEIANEKLPFSVRVKDYQINGEVLSRAKVVETATRLSTALATVEGQFSSAEGLVPQAVRAQESEGRASVWREAFKAIGEPESKDLAGAAKRLAEQPERAAKLLAELKARFQKEMLTRFKQQGGEMQFAAERLEKKEPVTADAFPVLAKNGAAPNVVVLPQPETKEMDKGNLPFAVIELMEGGKSIGDWLVSPWLNPTEIEAGGKTWRVALRPERTYQRFAVKLLKTTHEVYRGTEIPKNFQSRVRIENAARGENREVDIYMNNPLRYEGLTFFQYQMGADERDASVGTSTLQVVRNPSWLTPYLGCVLVGLGMAYQFLYHLVGFVAKRRTA